jgi:hypothetical protein
MVDSRHKLILTGEYERFSVGRLIEGDPLALVFPFETVVRLTESCAAARAAALSLPPLAGADAIEDLVELMHALLGGYAKVAAADALAARSTETLQQALSEIAQLRAELDKS